MSLRHSILLPALVAALPAAAQQPVTLTDANADGTTAVVVGQAIAIRLPANASTGRAWRVMKSTNATVGPVQAEAAGGGTGMLGGGETAVIRVGFRTAGRASVMLGEFGPRSGSGPEQVLHFHFAVAPVGARMRAR